MNKNILILFIGLFAAYLGQSILSPVFSPLVREMGLTEFHGGLILSSAALTWTLSSPLWGRKSETWGRKPVFIIGLAGYGIASLFFAFISDRGLRGLLPPLYLLLLLMLARILVGSLLSGSPTSALAYVADITEGKERTRSISLISAAMGLGTILGPALGALAVYFGLVAPIYLAAIIALIGAFVSLIFMDRSKNRKPREELKKLSPFDDRIRLFLLIGFIMYLTLSITQIVVGFYFQDRLSLTAQETAQKVGMAFVFKGIAVVFTQMWLVRIMRTSPVQLIRIGVPLIFLSILFFIFGKTYWGLNVAMITMGLGIGFVQPGYYSATSLSVNEDEQGAVAGLSTSALAFSSVLGQTLGGAFYQISSLLPFLISLATLIMCIVIIFFQKLEL